MKTWILTGSLIFVGGFGLFSLSACPCAECDKQPQSADAGPRRPTFHHYCLNHCGPQESGSFPGPDGVLCLEGEPDCREIHNSEETPCVEPASCRLSGRCISEDQCPPGYNLSQMYCTRIGQEPGCLPACEGAFFCRLDYACEAPPRCTAKETDRFPRKIASEHPCQPDEINEDSCRVVGGCGVAFACRPPPEADCPAFACEGDAIAREDRPCAYDEPNCTTQVHCGRPGACEARPGDCAPEPPCPGTLHERACADDEAGCFEVTLCDRALSCRL